MRHHWLPALLFVTIPLPVFGQTAPTADGSTPSALGPLYACAEKTDTAERLACYDAAVAELKGREARREVVTLDQEKVETLRREAFGFRLPSLPRLGLPTFSGDGEDTEGEERQTKSIVRVTGGTLTTSDGQIWRLNEGEAFDAPRTRPFNVVIRSGRLGSYLMTLEGKNRSWRVKRLD